MKTIALSWRYLWSRPMGAALNVLLLSLGLASITFLLLVSFQLDKAFENFFRFCRSVPDLYQKIFTSKRR